MGDELTIGQIREAKRKAEKAITDILCSFSTLTGISVASIKPIFIDVTTKYGPIGEYRLGKCTIEIDQNFI
jgi:hypothetical protein